MSTIFDHDVLIHHIAAPGLPGDGFTPAEATAIRSDMDTMLSRPVITKLTDIPDVVGSPANGQAPVWDADDEEWQPSDVGLPVAGTSFGNPITSGIRLLNTTYGLTVTNDAPGGLNRFSIAVTFAGTGSANSAARSDHSHTNPIPVFQMFNASGYMSGGSRQLVSRSVTLAAGIPYIVVAKLRPQMRGADSGAGYFTMTVSINGNTRTSPGGATSGFWCVQGVPNKEEWKHAVAITGTGAAITVTGTVTYHSGAGFNVDAGELEIELKPAR